MSAIENRNYLINSELKNRSEKKIKKARKHKNTKTQKIHKKKKKKGCTKNLSSLLILSDPPLPGKTLSKFQHKQSINGFSWNPTTSC
jgi:hypothetical protein